MRRKYVGSAGKLRAFALVVMIAGCGGPSGVAEKSSPPAKAIDLPASVGTTTEPVAVSAVQSIKTAKPAAKPESRSSAVIPVVPSALKPTPSAAPAELADTRQLVRVLDLSKLPAPEGAKVTEQFATQLRVNVPLSVPAATEFYLAKLQVLGWQRVGDPASSSIAESFAQVSLGKDGYQLTLTAMQGKPKEAGVTIAHVGNLDTRTLPRVDGAEDQYSCSSSSLYFTSVKVEEATATLRRLFAASGWQEYDQAFSQKADRPDTADLLFRKNAYSVGVSISKPATQPNKSAVQCYVTTLMHDLPAPADARHVEMQDSRWILMCEVPRDLAATAEYYRKVMPEIGFPSQPHETPSDQSMTLSFESEGHDLVLVSLKAEDEHTTKVKLEGYSATFREAMKKAEAIAKAKREAQEKADSQAKAERGKAFEEASKRQDDMINSAIGSALKEATSSSKQSDLSKKIQADVQAQLGKAFPSAGVDDPADQPEKKTKKPKPEDDAPTSLPEPKRKDKPKQGIGNLPKLDNTATVTINDKPFKMTSIIAYEVISNGQRRTRIVSTEKPIKQEPLLAMLKKTSTDDGLKFPEPHLKIELDDEDRPVTLGLFAGGTPGAATSSKLSGEALVEDGRARGTVKLKEPGSFIGKVYTAEISFDVPVLTRAATPAKRLTGAPKLANSGKLTIGDTTYKLPNVVAYEVKVFDEKRTALFFSEKPINLKQLKASLKKDGTDDDMSEFQPHVRLQIDKSDEVKQMDLWADNSSVSSNANLSGDVVIEDGRVRGTAKLTKPGEVSSKTYTFEVSFDLEVLPLPEPKNE